jgi:hypothetical protein
MPTLATSLRKIQGIRLETRVSPPGWDLGNRLCREPLKSLKHRTLNLLHFTAFFCQDFRGLLKRTLSLYIYIDILFIYLYIDRCGLATISRDHRGSKFCTPHLSHLDPQLASLQSHYRNSTSKRWIHGHCSWWFVNPLLTIQLWVKFNCMASRSNPPQIRIYKGVCCIDIISQIGNIQSYIYVYIHQLLNHIKISPLISDSECLGILVSLCAFRWLAPRSHNQPRGSSPSIRLSILFDYLSI